MEEKTNGRDWKTIVFVALVALSLGLNGYAFARVNDLQASVEDKTRTQDPSLADLRAEVETMSARITGLETGIETLQIRVSALDSSNDNLSASLGQILARLSAAESDIAALQGDLTNLGARIDVIEASLTPMQSTIASLQVQLDSVGSRAAALESQFSSLQTAVALLEIRRALVIRVSFLTFTQDNMPSSGNDWLIDIEIAGGNCVAQGRTGHSRYVVPKYLDLSTNRTVCTGAAVTVKLYAYWHLDDALIDIDPKPADGRCGLASPTDPAGCFLTLTYTVGTTVTGSADGNADGFLLDAYDGQLQYRIETLP